MGIPRKCLEEKAETLASQGEWVSFIDVLALLVFGIVLFPNVDGLVDLAAIDAFLAYAYDTFDLRCEKSSARIVCCTPALYVWLVSHVFFIMKVDLFVPYKVIACAPKRVKQIGKNSWQA